MFKNTLSRGRISGFCVLKEVKVSDKIRIRDKRKGVFTVDNVVLNHYGKAMGTTGIALYVTLCRFANNQTQKCYPSIRKIKEETGMHQDTIIETADRLAKLKLIKKEVKVGKWTIYTLLEPRDNGKEKEKILKEYYRWSEIRTGRKLGKVWSDIDTGGRKLGNKRTKINELRKRTKNIGEKKFSRDMFKKILDKFQSLKGIQLKGDEYLPHQRYIKQMLSNGRTLEQIIGCMEWLDSSDEDWTADWQMSTVYKKIPQFCSANNTTNNPPEYKIPDYAKDFTTQINKKGLEKYKKLKKGLNENLSNVG